MSVKLMSLPRSVRGGEADHGSGGLPAGNKVCHSPGMGIFEDLAAEQERLEKILAGLDEAQWRTASAAEGWTVADVVLHLAQSDEAAAATATHGTLRG